MLLQTYRIAQESAMRRSQALMIAMTAVLVGMVLLFRRRGWL